MEHNRFIIKDIVVLESLLQIAWMGLTGGVDWSIHDKGDGNPHVHLLMTMRPFNPDHSWGNKEVKDWIKSVISINLITLLLLVYVVYIGIRCYVKDWLGERGYY